MAERPCRDVEVYVSIAMGLMDSHVGLLVPVYLVGVFGTQADPYIAVSEREESTVVISLVALLFGSSFDHHSRTKGSRELACEVYQYYLLPIVAKGII